MDYLIFLLAILHVYKVLCEEKFWDTTVKLAKNMTLECVYPSTDTLTQMEWFKVNAMEKESLVIFNPTYGAIIRQPYADRVYFSNSTVTPNDMTLSFHNASEADVGFYSCFLHTFPHGPWEKVIQVVPPDSFEIDAPSNSHILSEPGKNVTLTCQLQMKWPLQQVTWEKIQPHQIDLLTTLTEILFHFILILSFPSFLPPSFSSFPFLYPFLSPFFSPSLLSSLPSIFLSLFLSCAPSQLMCLGLCVDF
uniref:CD226 molecule n=1 Tax=Equus asinus asinus TaxID=83772 RepID=A0A8C4MZ56_EQUAS